MYTYTLTEEQMKAEREYFEKHGRLPPMKEGFGIGIINEGKAIAVIKPISFKGKEGINEGR